MSRTPVNKGTQKTRGPYRKQYKQDDLEHAYRKVICENMSVLRAAKQCNVPETTLRDKVKGKNNLKTLKPRQPTLLTAKEEQFLVKHINMMGEIGYGYTQSEILDKTNDYAVHLGHREKDQDSNHSWLYNFLEDHAQLKILKENELELAKSMSATSEADSPYFRKLKAIVDKNVLENSPQSVYVVDVKALWMDVSTGETTAGVSSETAATGETTIVTMISAFGATGTSVPPYFVFPGKCMRDELLSRATPGVLGTATETGECNADIFSDYIKYHFLKFVPARSVASRILVLCDDYKNHVSLPLLTWAQDNHIVLFPLPPNCDGQLPLDGGCSDTFESRWADACCIHRLGNDNENTARCDVCRFACEIHASTMTPANVTASFKKMGIHPLKSVEISTAVSKPKEFEKLAHETTGLLCSDKTCLENTDTVKIKTEPLDQIQDNLGDWEEINGNSCCTAVKIKNEPLDQVRDIHDYWKGNKRKYCLSGVQVFDSDSDSELIKIRKVQGPSKEKNKGKGKRGQEIKAPIILRKLRKSIEKSY